MLKADVARTSEQTQQAMSWVMGEGRTHTEHVQGHGVCLHQYKDTYNTHTGVHSHAQLWNNIWLDLANVY